MKLILFINLLSLSTAFWLFEIFQKKNTISAQCVNEVNKQNFMNHIATQSACTAYAKNGCSDCTMPDNSTHCFSGQSLIIKAQFLNYCTSSGASKSLAY
ncbi:unnamed protein product [Blumeria hordei]|uniref:Secreted protein n=1 Tax=Blumeria hordei TaxID=2867405 RepID=A0A383UPT2_BLUHO|nr:unnamed protein product [Blumeria hordei]